MIPSLTEKQKRVLELRAQGYRNKQIADMLGISEVTIHQHLRACCRRLDALNTAHAIALATDAGILTKLTDKGGKASAEMPAAEFSKLRPGHAEQVQRIVLTPKEHEILNWVLRGETNLEIAARYKITLNTVEAYFARMYRRNNVSGRMKLAITALGAQTIQS